VTAVDAPAQDAWDNLPPHLREALREALEGLQDAYLDLSHPMSPALQAVWDVTEEIEAYTLAREKGEIVSAFGNEDSDSFVQQCNTDTQHQRKEA
jgi:hypothetical protein